jgi:hypothetical protein
MTSQTDKLNKERKMQITKNTLEDVYTIELENLTEAQCDALIEAEAELSALPREYTRLATVEAHRWFTEIIKLEDGRVGEVLFDSYEVQIFNDKISSIEDYIEVLKKNA